MITVSSQVSFGKQTQKHCLLFFTNWKLIPKADWIITVNLNNSGPELSNMIALEQYGIYEADKSMFMIFVCILL